MGLPKQFHRLLVMNGVSYVISIYIGIFVNLYIWEANHRISDVAWYNLVMFFVWGFAFLAGARLMARYTIRLLIALSALFGGIAFLLLSYLELDNRLLWIAMIGLPVGIMWGLFSAATGLSVSLYGKGRDFGNFFAYQSIISQVLNMTVPLLAAQVIRIWGYPGSFSLMLVFIAALLVVSWFLPKISLKGLTADGESWLRGMRYRAVFTTPPLKWIIPACIAAGVYLQFQGLFGLLFTFSVTENKTVIALLNMMYTASSLIALLLYKKYKLKEKTWLWVGMLLISGGFVIVLYPVAPVLIVSNVLTTVGLFYFAAAWNGPHFRVISKLPPFQQARVLVWREFLLAISRSLMLVLILPVPEFKGGVFWSLLALTLFSLLITPYLQGKIDGEPDAAEQPKPAAASV